MLNSTYCDVTEATENFIRVLFATSEAMPPSEIQIRADLARAALTAWQASARSLVSTETHDAEYDRLEELVHELPQSARAHA